MNRTFKTALLVSVLAHVVVFAGAAWLPSRRTATDPTVQEFLAVVQMSVLADDPSPSPSPATVAAAVELPKPVAEIPRPPEPPKEIPPPPVVEKPKPAPPVEPVPIAPAPPVSAPILTSAVTQQVVAAVAPRSPNVEATSGRTTTTHPTPGPISSNAATNSAPSATGGETIRIHGVPAYRKRLEPIYPATARKRRQEGAVLLRVQLDAAGRVENAVIAKSSGFPLLDEAARTAVRDWEFEAAKVNSRPVPSEVEVPVRFQLNP